MSGGRRNDENGSKEGEGWASTLMKVAGAAAVTAAFAGGLYALLKQPEPDGVAVGASAGGGGGHTKEAQAVIVWTKPEVGWVKLNVDGSLWPESESAGCGGVLRDAYGNWIRGFAQKLDWDHTSRVDEAEKEAIFRGLQWARGIEGVRIRKLMVESDNEGIVNLVNNGRRTTDPLICGIRELLNDPHWAATLTCVSRDANQVADKLAGSAHALRSSHLCEYLHPPENCNAALSKDQRLANGITY